MTRTRRTLAGIATLAAALGVPAGLVLGTSSPASACAAIVSHGAAPLCGGGSGQTYTLTATPATTGPGDPVTLQMALTGIGTYTDLNPDTRFSIDGGTCAGNVCSSDEPGTHTVTATYASASGSATRTTPVTVLAFDHLAVSPVYTTAIAGQTIRYTISRAAADGTLLDDVSSRATVTLGGAPCPGAVCTATKAGEQILTVTLDGMSAGGAVLVLAGPATSILVTPTRQFVWDNIVPATFTARVVDAEGNTLGDVTNQATFAITPDGSCSGHTCYAAASGNHTVTATSGALSGSVTLDADGPVPTIAPSLPAGQVGVGYSAPVLTFQDSNTLVHPGSELPPGLSLSTDGVLSGTPTTAGTYTVYISAGNANGAQNLPTTIAIAPGTLSKPTVSIGSTSVPEGNSGRTPVVLTVHLSHASTTPVTVSWHTANGTAVAGKDYVAAHGTITIPAGQLSATVSVSVIGDKVKERNERFTVVLTSPKNATLGTARGTLTIANDD
jgi:hypothetical protein